MGHTPGPPPAVPGPGPKDWPIVTTPGPWSLPPPKALRLNEFNLPQVSLRFYITRQARAVRRCAPTRSRSKTRQRAREIVPGAGEVVRF